MTKYFKLSFTLLVAFTFTACTTITDIAKTGTVSALQYDFDIARLNHLEQISGHIEKYKQITGVYPFQGESKLQNYVYIATQKQQKYTQGGPPYSHKVTHIQALIAELQSKLGHDLQMPFDPQRVPTHKPNFYIYMVEGDRYYLAVHVHNDFPFSNKLANYYNKVEVTNNADRNRTGTWFRDDLINHAAFIKAKQATPNKPGYTEQLLQSLGGNNAF